MKSRICGCFILPLLLLSANAEKVKAGDSMNDVRRSLGVPRGEARVGDRELFYYDRGEIEAKAGIVTRVSLRSEQEQSALEAQRAAEAARLRENREIRQAQLNAEGEEIKARKLADPSFRTSPVSYQAAFWEDFSRRYPTVASAELLLEARVLLAREREEKRKQLEQSQRIADLEARIAAAENEVRLNHRAEGERWGDMRGYLFYANYPSQRTRDYCPSPGRVKSVTRFYEFPLPYATSPGMPPLQPVYRKDGDRAAGAGFSDDANWREDFPDRPSRRRF